MKSICKTILTVSRSSLSFIICPTGVDPYLLQYKYVSISIGH